MSEFVRVASVSEIPDPGKAMFEVDERLVVVVHVDGQFHCIDDVCTHDGGPLGDGELCGHELACPRHGAKFDVRTGKALTMPATEPTARHEVKVEGDDVLVKLSSES
ncbi:MAG: non-heme iron oxygenase ferredoxin subunit [Planctomycetales bacterium]|nr:non-heme iron oxygenase ferredoxin subunit [Planctomycetales bacterium]